MKRLFDFCAALVGIVVTSPVFAVLAAWIKADSPGPVFYRGLRSGRHGKPFRIFKFRSMVVDADRVGGPSTSGSDTRVTRSGRFIRRFKLDELAQLINVLPGDMSLVGPRPEVVDKVEQFTEEERRTLTVRPGITDWASIWNSDEGAILDGAPDADAVYEEVIKPTKRRLQLFYCDNRSFLTDLQILIATLRRIANDGWTPRQLRDYPSPEQLRARALEVIERQKKGGL